MLGSYFPKPSANGICVRQIAKELKKCGVDVTILATNPGDLNEAEVIEGINVYRIKARWFTRITQWCDANRDAKYSNVIRRLALLANRVRTILSFPTWPLISPLYTYRYYQKALELHKMNCYDGILSVYTPIDALLAGALMKRKCNDVKLMLYFLDCFSGGPAPRHLTKEWMERRGYMWEKQLFDSADIVFVMNSHKTYYSREKYEGFRDKIRVVDIPLMRELKPISNRENICFSRHAVNIVYTGSILRYVRDPRYMLETFKSIDKPNQYHFHVYGGGDCHDIIARYIEEGTGIKIINHGWVDPETAIGAMLEADVLINIGSSVDTMVPSKIFEYMATGKPIISFFRHDTEPSIHYLGHYPLTLLIKEDWDNLHESARLVANFIDEYKGKAVKYDEVANTFQDNTPEMLARFVLESI